MTMRDKKPTVNTCIALKPLPIFTIAGPGYEDTALVEGFEQALPHILKLCASADRV
jgi:hypothetical protein